MDIEDSQPMSADHSISSNSHVQDQSETLSHTQLKSINDNNIKVYVRCRSRTQREIDEKSSVVISTMGLNGKKVILSQNYHAKKLYSSNSNQNDNNIKDNTPNANDKTYSFDKVFGVESDQETLFESVAKNYVHEMLQGYNCTVFAYGQTGTGKTYTMSGDLNILGDLESKNKILLGEHAGIIPRVLVYLFKELSKNDNKNNGFQSNEDETIKQNKTEHSVKVSFLELYNEKLRDLLSDYNIENNCNSNTFTENKSNNSSGNSTPNNQNNNFNLSGSSQYKNKQRQNNHNKLRNSISRSAIDNTRHQAHDRQSIRILNNHNHNTPTLHNNGSSIMVKGMEEIYIKSAHEGLQLLMEGSSKRKVASTKLNDLSSRSHTIFTIITSVTKIDTITGKQFVKTGKLNLVDLAGSENINRSGAENKRAQEAGLINKSLLTLGRVINALVDRSQHIPYRESKLTRLLQDSLGGKTKTCIIATISPAKISMEETVSTLEYATRAKSIKNTPQINQALSKDTFMHEYIDEIDKLRNELKITRTKGGIYITQDQFDLYESNSILITEQKAKIDNMEDQIKRFKTKYVEETEINKSLSNKLKKVDSINQKLTEKIKFIVTSYRQYQVNFDIFNEQIQQIHSSNRKIFAHLEIERDKLEHKCEENINALDNIIIACKESALKLNDIKDRLNLYSDRFQSVFMSVFNELEHNTIDFEKTIKHELILDSITTLAIEITNLRVITDQTFSDIINTSDQWTENYSRVYETHTKILNRSVNSLQDKCSVLQNLLKDTFENFENDLKVDIKKFEIVSNDHVEELKKIINEKSQEIKQLNDKLIFEQTTSKKLENNLKKVHSYFSEELPKSRKEITTKLINMIKNSEEKHQKLDDIIYNNYVDNMNMLNNENNLLYSDSINQMYLKSIESLNRTSEFNEQLTSKIQGYSNILLPKINSSIQKFPNGCELSNLINVIRQTADTESSEELYSMINVLNEVRSNYLKTETSKLNKEISSLNTSMDNVKEEDKCRLNKANSSIDKYLKYILTDYKDNMTQISKTQTDIMSENMHEIDGVIKGIEKSNQDNLISRYTRDNTTSYDLIDQELPTLEVPVNFKIYKDIEEEITGETNSKNVSPTRSDLVTNNKLILSTPVPIPDHPLPKVLIPKSINASAQRSKTLPALLKESQPIHKTSSEALKPNNLKRRFTTEPLVPETKEEQDDNKKTHYGS